MGHETTVRGNAASKHWNWRGGRRLRDGRVLVYAPQHPRAHNGIVYEHVLVVEKALGHFLPAGAIVHHVNERPDDNRNQNLVALQDRGEHARLHRRLRVLRAGGNPWTDRLCSICHLTKAAELFPRLPGRDRASLCTGCSKNQVRDWKRRQRGAA